MRNLKEAVELYFEGEANATDYMPVTDVGIGQEMVNA